MSVCVGEARPAQQLSVLERESVVAIADHKEAFVEIAHAWIHGVGELELVVG